MSKKDSPFTKILVPVSQIGPDGSIPFFEIEASEKPTLAALVSIAGRVWYGCKPEEIQILPSSRIDGLRISRLDAILDAASEDILDQSIDILGLSVRATNVLKSEGVVTLRQLVAKTAKELRRTQDFGRKSLNEVNGALREKGLQLRMENT